jgi:hypothetical protein
MNLESLLRNMIAYQTGQNEGNATVDRQSYNDELELARWAMEQDKWGMEQKVTQDNMLTADVNRRNVEQGMDVQRQMTAAELRRRQEDELMQHIAVLEEGKKEYAATIEKLGDQPIEAIGYKGRDLEFETTYANSMKEALNRLSQLKGLTGEVSAPPIAARYIPNIEQVGRARDLAMRTDVQDVSQAKANPAFSGMNEQEIAQGLAMTKPSQPEVGEAVQKIMQQTLASGPMLKLGDMDRHNAKMKQKYPKDKDIQNFATDNQLSAMAEQLAELTNMDPEDARLTIKEATGGVPLTADALNAEATAQRLISGDRNETDIKTTGMNNTAAIKATGMNNATDVKTTGMNNSTAVKVANINAYAQMYDSNIRARLAAGGGSGGLSGGKGTDTLWEGQQKILPLLDVFRNKSMLTPDKIPSGTEKQLAAQIASPVINQTLAAMTGNQFMLPSNTDGYSPLAVDFLKAAALVPSKGLTGQIMPTEQKEAQKAWIDVRRKIAQNLVPKLAKAAAQSGQLGIAGVDGRANSYINSSLQKLYDLGGFADGGIEFGSIDYDKSLKETILNTPSLRKQYIEASAKNKNKGIAKPKKTTKKG